MTRFLTLLGSLLAAGCVLPPQPMRVEVARPGPVMVQGPDLDCQRQRQEAQVSQRIANREREEARTYGGQREYRQAERTQARANQERGQAVRACD